MQWSGYPYSRYVNPLCVAILKPVVHLLLIVTLEGRNNKFSDEFCGLE